MKKARCAFRDFHLGRPLEVAEPCGVDAEEKRRGRGEDAEHGPRQHGHEGCWGGWRSKKKSERARADKRKT